jgi:hypothetical protein
MSRHTPNQSQHTNKPASVVVDNTRGIRNHNNNNNNDDDDDDDDDDIGGVDSDEENKENHTEDSGDYEDVDHEDAGGDDDDDDNDEDDRHQLDTSTVVPHDIVEKILRLRFAAANPSPTNSPLVLGNYCVWLRVKPPVSAGNTKKRKKAGTAADAPPPPATPSAASTPPPKPRKTRSENGRTAIWSGPVESVPLDNKVAMVISGFICQEELEEFIAQWTWDARAPVGRLAQALVLLRQLPYTLFVDCKQLFTFKPLYWIFKVIDGALCVHYIHTQ